MCIMSKKKTKRYQAHTDNTKHGMGDYYGTGVRNPMGTPGKNTMGVTPVSSKKIGKPPKSLA